jgi:hypothetical protein
MTKKRKSKKDRPLEVPESARRLRELYERGMAELKERESRDSDAARS